MTEVLPFECDHEHACRVEPDHECANANCELNPMRGTEGIMSDCSTAAMMPKEPPRTCGTCYWMMMQPGHGGCGACGNPICGIEKWPEAYGNGYYRSTTMDGDCKGEFWKPRTYVPARRNGKALEQRCQQLEQVAKRLLRSVEFAAALLDGRTRYVEFDWDAIRDLRKQLEALGVSVDD